MPLPAGCHRDACGRRRAALGSTACPRAPAAPRSRRTRRRAGGGFRHVRAARHDVGNGVGIDVAIQRPQHHGMAIFEDARPPRSGGACARVADADADGGEGALPGSPHAAGGAPPAAQPAAARAAARARRSLRAAL